MVEKNKILIIGVDVEVHRLIIEQFNDQENFTFTCLKSGKESLEKIKSNKFDVIILDEKIADITGNDLCQRIRFNNVSTPILYLSFHEDEGKMIKALQYGANDYLVKPLSFEEIKYKVINIIKLLSHNNDTVFNDIETIGNFNIDFKSFTVTDTNKNEFKLTKRQVNLLKLLVDKNNEVVSRQEILEKIWGYDVFIKTRTIDNVILSLRKIFERDVVPNTYFKSVRGVGYKLTI